MVLQTFTKQSAVQVSSWSQSGTEVRQIPFLEPRRGAFGFDGQRCVFRLSRYATEVRYFGGHGGAKTVVVRPFHQHSGMFGADR